MSRLKLTPVLSDVAVCLGGDGTILWVSGLYNGPCPPIISFAMGSLGFLTPFDFEEYKEVIAKTAAGDVDIGIRTRLFACVHGIAVMRVCVCVSGCLCLCLSVCVSQRLCGA